MSEYIIVIDFETGSVSPRDTIPLSLAGKAYNLKTLEPATNGEFYFLMKPKNEEEWNKIEDKALEVNKLTREELKTAPERKIVWQNFVDYTKKYCKSNYVLDRPIAAGHNIRNFDMIIIEKLCQEFGQAKKNGEQSLFNPRDMLDLKDILFLWYSGNMILKDFKLDTVRQHFGISDEKAHRADNDVKVTGELLTRFMKLHRRLFDKVPTLKGGKLEIA